MAVKAKSANRGEWIDTARKDFKRIYGLAKYGSR